MFAMVDAVVYGKQEINVVYFIFSFRLGRVYSRDAALSVKIKVILTLRDEKKTDKRIIPK